MRTRVLLREAAATTWASKVPSLLIALLVAAMVAATLATVGRTAAAEEQLAGRLDDAGSRNLILDDQRRRGLLTPTLVKAAGSLTMTERAVGFTGPSDVVAGAIGAGSERAPAWGIVGAMSDAVTLVSGRWPQPGEALISQSTMDSLGFSQAAGWVESSAGDGREYAVVGAFRARDPFRYLDVGLVFAEGEIPVDTLSVVLNDPAHAARVQAAVVSLVAPADPTDLRVTSPVGAAELRAQLLGDFGVFSRALLLAVLGVGALLVGVVVFSDVLVRRRDIGRRRALGATRGAVVGLTLVRTLYPALIGALLGTAIGMTITMPLAAAPPLEFTLGVVILAVLTAELSTVVPAVFAANRDPVAVLRTP